MKEADTAYEGNEMERNRRRRPEASPVLLELSLGSDLVRLDVLCMYMSVYVCMLCYATEGLKGRPDPDGLRPISTSQTSIACDFLLSCPTELPDLL